jgi:uncharacterized protein
MNTANPLEKALAYLRAHNVMTLATDGPLGIWAADVFYVNDDFTLYFLSPPGSRHAANIEAKPSVSATIHEDYRDWKDIRGVQFEGEAARLEGLEKSRAVGLYAMKFPIVSNLAAAPAEIMQAYGRIAWFRAIPSRVFYIDNSLGLGHRDQLPV